MDGAQTNNQAHYATSMGRCGIDEAGRGPLAGPVVAAAVILPDALDLSILADSKALSSRQREDSRDQIISSGAAIGYGWVWPEEIDRLNIHNASLLAMSCAWEDLLTAAPLNAPVCGTILVDGLFVPPRLREPPGISLKVEALVGGDHLIPEIMAASILAKTARDTWMTGYARQDPRYGFERHKGYPTKMHKEAILRHGPSPIHRRTFRGVLTDSTDQLSRSGGRRGGRP